MSENAISISFAAVFTQITSKTFIFASAIEGRLKILEIRFVHPYAEQDLTIF